MSAEATKATPVKRAGKVDDGEPPMADAPKPKSGLLPTGLSRAIVLGSLVIGLVGLTSFLFGHRYNLVAAQRGDNALMYRIDTLTGRVSLCSATSCMPVAEKDSGG